MRLLCHDVPTITLRTEEHQRAPGAGDRRSAAFVRRLAKAGASVLRQLGRRADAPLVERGGHGLLRLTWRPDRMPELRLDVAGATGWAVARCGSSTPVDIWDNFTSEGLQAALMQAMPRS